MIAKTIITGTLGLVALGFASTSQALVMDFGAGAGSSTTFTTPYIEGPLTMTPLNTGSVPGSHWDSIRADTSDWAAAIHTGNNGEAVRFTFSGGAFDLLSISIEDILLASGVNSLTGTFSTSAGGSTTASAIGTVDFTALTGFSNILWVDFTMPLGVGSCSAIPNPCSSMIFDDVTYQRHAPGGGQAPVPATLALLGLGLAGIGYQRRKQNRAA